MKENLNKKKFCMIATNGVSLINFRGKLIEELVQRGYEVVCVSIEDDSEIGEAIRNLGARYVQVSGDRTGVGLLSGFSMIKRYMNFFKNEKPDISFMYMSKPIAFGSLAARLTKTKHYNILVNGLENAYYRTGIKDFIVRCVMSFLYKNASKKADNIFFQNHDDMNYFSEHKLLKKDSNAYVVNGSGVDMTHFTREELPDEPVILMVARLLWSKGIREFLSAITTVKQKNPQTKVLLVGGLDNNDEALTKDELDDFITKADIEYCGFASDVRPFLKRCSIFVLPSYHEGCPRCVLEAMATARPIVTTDVPGCKETVVDGVNGFIVPCRNSEALAEKINELVENAELRKAMAQKSFEMCEEKFEVGKVNDFIIERIEKEIEQK